MAEPGSSLLKTTISHLLSQCKSTGELRKIHGLIVTSPSLYEQASYFLKTRLLFFCAISEAGSLSCASKVFYHLEKLNLSVFNALIRGYASKN